MVERILAGSRADFERLYEAYAPRIYRFALKRLRSPEEAEDVTQEVFEALCSGLGSYRGQSSLLVWIFGITRNKVNRRFRRPPPELVDPADFDRREAPEVSTERQVEARRALERCQAAIVRDLTPLQRRIFHLKHLRRQSIRTIAQALDKSEDAIKANLYRMRKTLAQAAPGLDSLLRS